MNEDGQLTFGSMFAGVGGFDLGFERAGFKCLWQIENDKFCQGVLRLRFPNVPIFGDICELDPDALAIPDVITYGFPCQDISAANNNRKGLAGKRSGLFYEATRFFRRFTRRPSRFRFAVAENVAGLLNVDDCGGLAQVLRDLSECGAYESAWATLDSQYFGIPQRRRRIFIVSDFAKESSKEVLAIVQGLRRNYAAGQKKKQRKPIARDSSPSLGTKGARNKPEQVTSISVTSKWAKGSGGPSGQECGNMVVDDYKSSRAGQLPQCVDLFNLQISDDAAPSLTSRSGVPDASGPRVVDVYNLSVADGVAPTLTSATGIPNASGPKVVAWNGDTTPKASENICMTLKSQQGGEGVGVAYSEPVAEPIITREGKTPTNEGKNFKPRNLVADNLRVRKLTPVETCRLQGFPDDWNENQQTADGKILPVSDVQRYKQMGNAVSVPVAFWIAEQIKKQINHEPNNSPQFDETQNNER